MPDNQVSLGGLKADPVSHLPGANKVQEKALHSAGSQHSPAPGSIQAEAEREVKEAENSGRNPASLPDISLKFMVDAKTKDLTVLLLDRNSQKVVRTIPPEEISNLQPGDLLEFFV